MGGWEILIFAFGGIWYVVSAIAQAKEKAKKKKLREEALARERAEEAGEIPSEEQEVAVVRSSVDDALAQLRGSPSPAATQVTVAPPVAGGETARDARKLILDAMRREMGLPPMDPAAPAASEARPATATRPAPEPPAPRVRPSVTAAPKDPRTRVPQSTPRSDRTPSRTAPDTATTSPSVTARTPRSGPRSGLGASHRDPASLKQAIILAEVLGPPVSLRPEHLTNQ